MEYVEWNEELSVDVVRFDKQHRRWINNLNNLFKTIQRGADNQEVSEYIKIFRRYTYYHLKDEEKVLADYNYPHVDEQRREHENYRARIEELEKNFKKDLAVKEDLIMLLKRWLLKHLKETDKKYSSFLPSNV